MHIHEKTKVRNPLKNPQGETVYELVGSSVNSGSASLHSLAVIVRPRPRIHAHPGSGLPDPA
jgi:hypothetical protein